MTILKRLVYFCVSAMFCGLLLLTPLLFGVSAVIHDQEVVQKALDQSGIYDQFIETAIENTKKQNTSSDSAQVLSDPGVEAAITDAFDGEVLKTASESFINDLYIWLDGAEPEFMFTIDLSAAKDELTQNLATYAQQKTAGLPVCTLQQLQTINLTGDILSLPCLPPGITPEQAGVTFSEQAIAEVEFLQNPVITEKTLRDDTNNVPDDELSSIRTAYASLKTTKWLFLAITLVLATVLVLARKNRVRGAYTVAWNLVGAGLLLFIGVIVYHVAFKSIDVTSVETTEQIVIRGATVLLDTYNATTAWFAGAYLVGGAAVLIALRTHSRPIHNNPGSPKSTDHLVK